MKRFSLLKLIAKASILLSLSSSQLYADYVDYLDVDDGGFHSGKIKDAGPRWTDGFKTTLQHSHTQATDRVAHQESSIRLEYETSIGRDWYLRVDGRYRYFWKRDDLAERRGGRYGHTKYQAAWIQYSRGPCAAKLGRQRLIWGEVEGAFATDVIAPFDFTEQLLTDFGNVRLAQDMLVTDCYFDKNQIQFFATPRARTDIFEHQRTFVEISPGQPPVDMTVSPNEEWGFRYKWLGSGFDVSLMYGRLYGNTPTIIVRHGQPEAAVSRYDMIGLNSSIAYRRLLVKGEVAFKNNQLIPFSDETTDRWDVALGLEYTTRTNHILNAGIWLIYLDDIDVSEDRDGTESSPIEGLLGTVVSTLLANGGFPGNTADAQEARQYFATIGWRKSYLNDNLVMSLLGNWGSSPRFTGITVLSEYQWTDLLNISLAIAHANSKNNSIFNPLMDDGTSITLGIKYEF